MTDEKHSWDDIPSIEDISVEWDYAPENSLGDRECIRLDNRYLCTQFQIKKIPVKIVSKDMETSGSVLDLGKKGLGFMLGKHIEPGKSIKIGLYLGKVKVVSRAVVRYSKELNQRYRVGVEFEGLAETSREYIAGLVSSKVLSGNTAL